MQRKNAILIAANHHFAHHGFRGASLRDIARDAQVSLTLLNHHFGSKYQLLSAVIDSHRKMLDDRAAQLLALVTAGPGTFTVRDLVQVWIRIGFETASQPDGENFLRLMARVIDDSSEEAAQVVREKLDDAALVFIDALQICYPKASRYAAASFSSFLSPSSSPSSASSSSAPLAFLPFLPVSFSFSGSSPSASPSSSARRASSSARRASSSSRR